MLGFIIWDKALVKTYICLFVPTVPGEFILVLYLIFSSWQDAVIRTDDAASVARRANLSATHKIFLSVIPSLLNVDLTAAGQLRGYEGTER